MPLASAGNEGHICKGEGATTGEQARARRTGLNEDGYGEDQDLRTEPRVRVGTLELAGPPGRSIGS